MESTRKQWSDAWEKEVGTMSETLITGVDWGDEWVLLDFMSIAANARRGLDPHSSEGAPDKWQDDIIDKLLKSWMAADATFCGRRTLVENLVVKFFCRLGAKDRSRRA
jgi:hypothetical protein